MHRETEGNPFFVQRGGEDAGGRGSARPRAGRWLVGSRDPAGCARGDRAPPQPPVASGERGARHRRRSWPRLRPSLARPGERQGRDRAARCAGRSDGGASDARGARDAGPLPLRARAGARHPLRGDQRAAAHPSPSRRRRSARSRFGRGRGAGPSPVGGAAAGRDRAPLLPIGAGRGPRAHGRRLRARGGVGAIAAGVGGRGASSRARGPGAGDDRAARSPSASASWS